jgi:hypothetical protein
MLPQIQIFSISNFELAAILFDVEVLGLKFQMLCQHFTQVFTNF